MDARRVSFSGQHAGVEDGETPSLVKCWITIAGINVHDRSASGRDEGLILPIYISNLVLDKNQWIW